jgi:hypothetical protein
MGAGLDSFLKTTRAYFALITEFDETFALSQAAVAIDILNGHRVLIRRPLLNHLFSQGIIVFLSRNICGTSRTDQAAISNHFLHLTSLVIILNMSNNASILWGQTRNFD